MILDRSQQEIVAIKGEHALVLAGPGCGKTHILSQRIIAANADGVPFDEMVCLTFTNRASREMNRRITAETGYKPDGLFVGNIHRFCIRFLYDNAIVPDGTTVIDEDDRDMWLAEAMGIKRAFERKQVLDTGILLYQQEHGFPKSLHRRLAFTPSASHIHSAMAYRDYKNENLLIDFDDVLLMTYEALSSEHTSPLRLCKFRWLQIDEVQDLTPLQLAIIDLITSDDNPTAVYFGDEQQAIFEFIGAGGPALDKLKIRCHNHTYRLRRNYRSPSYLVDLCNSFASSCMGMNPAELPDTDITCDKPQDGLQLLYANDYNLTTAVAAKVRSWRDRNPDESIAVLVRTNDEAEDISATLTDHSIAHTLISRKDLFKQVSYKTVFAHFAVIANPLRATEWMRILYQTNAVRTLAEARSFVYALRQICATPADLMTSDGKTALGRMTETFTDGEIVVFDTETTGLDVFNDDIIQIAAVKYRNGKRVDDGGFEVLIWSDRPIPPMLNDGIVNPMADVYRNGNPIEAAKALEAFSNYVGNATLCGHNVEFDCEILRNNYLRHTKSGMPEAFDKPYVDTLFASRLLYPHQRSYTLQSMIALTGIEGVNSHNATDDVNATAGLLEILCRQAVKKVSQQTEFIDKPIVRRISQRLNELYRPIYRHTLESFGKANTGLADEMDAVYNAMSENGIVKPIGRWTEVISFISSTMGGNDSGSTLRDDIKSRLYELRTFNEGDLIASGCGASRITVTTIHKAKGLEFDNVILYNAREQSIGRPADNSRVFYVAFSRARRRLAVFCTGRLSHEVAAVADKFSRVSDDEVEASALIERLQKRL